MVDPLQPVFGIPARQLFSRKELTATHGPLERFPSFMFEGALASIDALCRDYTGAVEVAQGSSA